MPDDTKIVGVDEHGNRVGEDHPRAVLTDHEVELIRQLYEERKPGDGMTMRVIAEKFEISVSHVCRIVNFSQRATYPVGYRRVAITVNGKPHGATLLPG